MNGDPNWRLDPRCVCAVWSARVFEYDMMIMHYVCARRSRTRQRAHSQPSHLFSREFRARCLASPILHLARLQTTRREAPGKHRHAKNPRARRARSGTYRDVTKWWLGNHPGGLRRTAPSLQCDRAGMSLHDRRRGTSRASCGPPGCVIYLVICSVSRRRTSDRATGHGRTVERR